MWTIDYFRVKQPKNDEKPDKNWERGGVGGPRGWWVIKRQSVQMEEVEFV